MMNVDSKMSILIGALLLAILTGCASTPSSIEDSIPVPINRIIAPKMTQDHEGYGGLIVKRDNAFVTGACVFRLYIDNKPFADIKNKEWIKIYLNSGDHIIGAKPTGFCILEDVESPVTIKPGETQIYRLSASGNDNIKLGPTAF